MCQITIRNEWGLKFAKCSLEHEKQSTSSRKYKLQNSSEWCYFISSAVMHRGVNIKLQINVSEPNIYICRILFALYVAKQYTLHRKPPTLYCSVFPRRLVDCV